MIQITTYALFLLAFYDVFNGIYRDYFMNKNHWIYDRVNASR